MKIILAIAINTLLAIHCVHGQAFKGATWTGVVYDYYDTAGGYPDGTPVAGVIVNLKYDCGKGKKGVAKSVRSVGDGKFTIRMKSSEIAKIGCSQDWMHSIQYFNVVLQDTSGRYILRANPVQVQA
ncbi:hypothetical protein Ddc_14409 [Ditylenchus destructor]|nr:hypothetical protein Ddc_14409 [Ditylenchus destructor]